MGRLEDIVERNKNPRKGSRAGMTMGIGLALFVFIVLVLMVFTDLDESPDAQQPPAAPAADDGTKRVRGIQLYRPKQQPRDAAVP